MQSVVLQLGRDHSSPGALRDAARRALGERGGDRDPARPDLVCSFLPPGGAADAILEAIAAAWPESVRVGCEAVTQFAGGRTTADGTLQLFWFSDPEHRAEVLVVEGTREEPPADGEAARVARGIAGGNSCFLLADGLRFPAARFLGRLQGHLEEGPVVVGGLASQVEPIATVGARVFHGRKVLAGAALVVVLHGVEMEVELVRGWDPASPIFTVTAAEDDVLWAIDGEPATDWYRRFFTVDGELAPLPEAALRFPLILDGPRPGRSGLYRSMKAFDTPPGGVTFWGDLQVGDRVRLGMGNDASLLRTAARLPDRTPPEAAMLYSCVGREAVLGPLAEREVETIHRALRGASLAGFFSFGEVGPADEPGAGTAAFYNQTAVLALLRELP